METLRQQHTKTRTFDEWFKQTTKLVIYETPSLELPDHSVLVSEHFRTQELYERYLLPSLTVSEDSVYVISNMTTLTLGGFERHYDANQFQGDVAKPKIVEVKVKLTEYPNKIRDFFDLWYRVSKPHVRTQLLANYWARSGFVYPGKHANEYGNPNYKSVSVLTLTK